MSRIGKQPIALPPGVAVTVDGADVNVKGPKGELTVPFRGDHISVEAADSTVIVGRDHDAKESMALHGLTRALIANAVKGVTEGHSKRLDVYGVGFRAEIGEKQLVLHIGFSHAVEFAVPDDIELISERPTPGAQASLLVQGIDKQKVGQVAAEIRDKRPPDPYKGKGIRYENEVIHWKAGKAAVA